MTLAHALDGIRVLDLSRLLPGPYLTMLLADMGADVVKVEAPQIGDYLRVMPPARGGISGRFAAINRNKRSLVLDLKSEPGRDAFLRMVERADVVVESFRPGVIERLGIGYDALRARNPGVVLCSISGFGQTGSYRERAGHDLGYIALAGVLAMGGSRDGAPGMPGVQIADLAGGALWSATAILAALLARTSSGEGQHLDISMTEGALALLAAELGNLACAPEPAPSRGNQALNGGLACYRVYQSGDGKYLAVGALEPKFWLQLNRALGREAHAGEVAAPPEQQERIAAELAAIFRTRSRDEWTAILREYDCCVEPVLELDELDEHPLHRERELFFSLPGAAAAPASADSASAAASAASASAASWPQVRTPLGTPSGRGLPPRLGEHSREVLGDYGFDTADIEALCPPRD
ncbi:CaiB/BaiF CoA transferase family protein [Haliangium ochraceum]|uniref:L-carnitine dehydratase/bile acid-inducible protein F n=1 Tax=Haliangium ochraceum (strain DSM 14365 / JCM 11303 / SMP-2) TaxID=502025 RepID=D0LQD4_HALO1|nr:CaiB/BaiF CoA-transferase family protein [Haliangium ochraceum]ACY18943.1 L-carnitine dehydratase/bile acid-inducible protein F [Haliangium ochraceum DSM 14365]